MIFTVIMHPSYLFKRPFTVWYKLFYWFLILYIMFITFGEATAYDAFIGLLGNIIIVSFFKGIYALILKLLNKSDARKELCEREKKILDELSSKDKSKYEELKRKQEEAELQKAKQAQIDYEEKQKRILEYEKEKMREESRFNALNEKLINGSINDTELEELAKMRVSKKAEEDYAAQRESEKRQKEFYNNTPYGICPKCKKHTLMPVSNVKGGGYSIIKGTAGAVVGSAIVPGIGTVVGLAAGHKKNKTKILFVCSNCGYKTDKIKK